MQNRGNFLRDQRVLRRRRKKRLVLFYFYAFIAVFIIGGSAALTHVGAFSISTITVQGNQVTDAEAVEAIARGELSRSYMYIYSSDNILLMPSGRIQVDVLNAFPRLSTVKVHRTGISSIEIQVVERQPAALWCGPQIQSAGSARASINVCYLVDGMGYVFAVAPASGSPSYMSFYGTLGNIPGSAGSSISTSTSIATGVALAKSIGVQFVSPSDFQTIMDLSGRLQKIGLPVVSVYVDQGHEYDMYVKNNGEVIFSYQDPLQEMDNLNSALASGVFYKATSTASNVNTVGQYVPFQYIDVRFGNKVFYKLGNASSANANASTSTTSGISTSSASSVPRR